MAKPQDKTAFMNSVSPIREHDNEEANNVNDYYYEEETVSGSDCGCFCFQWKPSRERETNSLLGEHRETWFVEKIKKVKEGSELLAGPKWKNFIRKIGKLFNKKKKSRTQFQYDPQSYALNFDEGRIDDDEDEEDDGFLFGFSSRFAPPLSNEERRAGL